ncbi:unnamed protein product [Phaeothamnion confervicola]
MADAEKGASAGMTTDNQGTWDSTTQTFHGGQDWKFLHNFVEDFSVTTNGLGTPKPALEAARRAVEDISHYPPSDFEPAISHLAAFLWPDADGDATAAGAAASAGKELMLLGNGASELIDLVVRQAKPGRWRPGPQLTQYKEYERSALAAGFATAPHDDGGATLLCMVNPTNPTGDYWTVPEMRRYIETSCAPGTTVIVDESMQPWLGPEWRSDSLLGERNWARNLSEGPAAVHVWVMTSWTKIWSCTGVRLGSVVAPTAALQRSLKAKQVPWSVNVVALAFLSAVVRDTEYLRQTWDLTPRWNAEMRAELARRHPTWEVHGKPFLSWLWVDTKDATACVTAVARAKAAGVPVRSGAPGYNLPTFFRAAVRPAEQAAVLFQALAPLEV